MSTNKNAIRPARADRIYEIVNTVLLLLVFLIVAYPLYFVVIASISDPLEVSRGSVILFPKGINFKGYARIFDFDQIWLGYRNTIFYTILGTVISVVTTVLLAYPLSRKDFMLRGPLMAMVTITMFFSGGMIPTYLVINQMGMLDTVWAVVLPGAISATNVIITRTFFQSLPTELREAAAVDGATNFKLFTYIIVPLSKAIIAVIALYYASGLWNQYFGPMLYLSKKNLYPLQLFLRQVLLQSDMEGVDVAADSMQEEMYLRELIKYGVIIVSVVPMLCLYPFIQKYFVKGVMIGSVKG